MYIVLDVPFLYAYLCDKAGTALYYNEPNKVNSL